MVDTDSIDS